MKHLFIINPTAGGKKHNPEETKQRIEAVAESLSLPYEIYFTKGTMDACRKVAEEAERTDELRVYACGGDGTLSECANGAAGRSNTAITHFPCGTGNDFIKTFGNENISKFKDLRALISGKARPMDLIDCDENRFGINICSVGIDARVGRDVHKFSKLPIIGGATGYVIALITNVIAGVAQKFHIRGGGIDQNKDITLMCACNGKFYGGGFNPVPDAIPDDGIIEFLVIEPVSRLKVASVVGKYAKGKFREIEELVTHIRSDYMEMEGEREFVVNVDGEILYRKKLHFKIFPKGVNFILPQGVDY